MEERNANLQQGNKKYIKINWQQWERVAKSQHLRGQLIVKLGSEEQDSKRETPNKKTVFFLTNF